MPGRFLDDEPPPSGGVFLDDVPSSGGRFLDDEPVGPGRTDAEDAKQFPWRTGPLYEPTRLGIEVADVSPKLGTPDFQQDDPIQSAQESFAVAKPELQSSGMVERPRLTMSGLAVERSPQLLLSHEGGKLMAVAPDGARQELESLEMGGEVTASAIGKAFGELEAGRILRQDRFKPAWQTVKEPTEVLDQEKLGRWENAANSFAQSALTSGVSAVQSLGKIDEILNERNPRFAPRQAILARNAMLEEANEAIRLVYPTDPRYQGEFFSSVLPSGAGSLLPFVLSGTIGGPIASAALGSMMTAQQEYEAARNAGADEATARKAMGPGAIFGTLEGVMGVGAKGARVALPKKGGSLIWQAIKEGNKEGGQEALTQLLQTANATQITGYDKTEQDISQLWKTYAAGAILGGAIKVPGLAADRLAQIRQQDDPLAALEEELRQFEQEEEQAPPQPAQEPQRQRAVAPFLAADGEDRGSEVQSPTAREPKLSGIENLTAEELLAYRTQQFVQNLNPETGVAATAEGLLAVQDGVVSPIVPGSTRAKSLESITGSLGEPATEQPSQVPFDPTGGPAADLSGEAEPDPQSQSGASPESPRISTAGDIRTGASASGGDPKRVEIDLQTESGLAGDVAARPSSVPARIPVAPIPPAPGMEANSPYRIIEDFSRAIGKAVRVRRLGKRFLGMYRPGSTITIDRFAGDLDTTAHELAGHFLDDKNGLGKPWARSHARSPYDSELERFWWHGSSTSSGPRSTLQYKRAEGIAEFVRAYIMNPDDTKAAAPTFTAYFESNVAKDELKAVQQFGQDVRRWAGEDPVVRAGLNVRMEQPSTAERLWNSLRSRGGGFEFGPIDRLRLWFDDPYWGATKAFRLATELKQKVTPQTLKPSENFELLSRLLATHDARISDQLEHGLAPLRPRQTKTAKGLQVERVKDAKTGEPMTLKWLLAPFDTSSRKAMLDDMRQASGFMVAQRTLEKAEQADQDAAAAIAALDSKNPDYPKQVRKILADVAQRKQRLTGIGAGIMSDVTAAQEAVKKSASDSKRKGKLQEAARRYRAWAAANIQMLVDSGRLSPEAAAAIREENEFYVDLHRLSEEFEVGGRQRRGIGAVGTTRDVVKKFKGSTLEIDNVYRNLLEQTDSIQREAHRNLVMRAFTDMLSEVRGMYEGSPKDFDQIGTPATSDDRNTIRVFKNGVGQYWKFDPDVFESLKGLGDLGTHLFVDLLAIPSRLMRALITLSPDFVARNVVRDQPHRAVVSRTGSKPWDILSGYSQDELSRFNVFGAGQFGNYIRDRLTWNRELKRSMAEMSKDPTNILVSPLKVFQAWEKIAHSSELIGRIAEFRKAFSHAQKEFGYDDYEAALFAAGEARGLIDYAQAGTVMRSIGKLVPFSNARLRGVIRTYQAFHENPGPFLVRWGLYALIPTALVYAWNRKDDETWGEYVQQPQYIRDFYWSFKVGPWWIRIPRPHELGVMAGGVERALERAQGDPNALEGFAKSVLSATLPAENLAELAGPLTLPMELAMNRDTFTDRTIVPFWEEDLKLELRKGQQYASGVGKIIGKALGTDARNVDHVLQSHGGLGKLAINLTKSRDSTSAALTKGTGYVIEAPSVSARDVQWVQQWSRENGKERSAEFKPFREARKAVLESKSAEERDELAKRLRKLATGMRKKIESRSGF